MTLDLRWLIPILAAAGLILLAIERLVPLRAPRRELLSGLLLNVVISAVAFGTSAALVQPAAPDDRLTGLERLAGRPGLEPG